MGLKNLLEKIEPHFTHGGKLEKYYPLYEAAATIFYTPGQVTKGASHVRDAIDLKRKLSRRYTNSTARSSCSR